MSSPESLAERLQDHERVIAKAEESRANALNRVTEAVTSEILPQLRTNLPAGYEVSFIEVRDYPSFQRLGKFPSQFSVYLGLSGSNNAPLEDSQEVERALKPVLSEITQKYKLGEIRLFNMMEMDLI
jgi:hypothetical protein